MRVTRKGGFNVSRPFFIIQDKTNGLNESAQAIKSFLCGLKTAAFTQPVHCVSVHFLSIMRSFSLYQDLE